MRWNKRRAPPSRSNSGILEAQTRILRVGIGASHLFAHGERVQRVEVVLMPGGVVLAQHVAPLLAELGEVDDLIAFDAALDVRARRDALVVDDDGLGLGVNLSPRRAQAEAVVRVLVVGRCGAGGEAAEAAEEAD